MAFTYITGADSIALDKINAPEGSISEQIIETIVGGNAQETYESKDLQRILLGMRQDFPRINGTPIPIEETVVKFSPADMDTADMNFRTTYSSFRTKENVGYQTGLYEFTNKELRNYNDQQIMEKILKSTRQATNAYVSFYQPYSILSDLITGTTFRDTIPALDAGTKSGFDGSELGFARGEKYDNYLLPTATSNTRNHYLTIEGAPDTDFSSSDIQRAIKLVKETVHYGMGGGEMQGVLVLGAPFTIQNVAIGLLNAPENKDMGIFGEVKPMYGAYFKEIEGMHEDFLIYIDMSYQERLIGHGVNEDVEQRGYGLIYENELTAFEKYEDVKGAKLFIFEEENYVMNRLSGVVQDINPARANVNGEMTTASETVLENWVKAMRSTYKA